MKPYTKEMQTGKKKKKIKVSMFHKKQKRMISKSNATTEEKEYLNWLKEQDLNCFICNKNIGIELHHIKEYSMQKKNHREVIPLCGVECHRLGKFSIHSNSKWFKSKYPLEMQREFASVLYSKYEAIIK